MSLFEDLEKRPYKAGYGGGTSFTTPSSIFNDLENRPLKTDTGEVGDHSTNILQSIFREPIELGKDLAGAFDPVVKRNYIEGQESKFKMLNKITDRYREGELSDDNYRRITSPLLGSPQIDMPEAYKKTNTQIMGDILGTAMWFIPSSEIRFLSKAAKIAKAAKVAKGVTAVARGGSLINRAVRGAAIGSIATSAYSMSEGADPEEIGKSALIGGAFGGILESTLPIAFKGMGIMFKKAGQAVKKTKATEPLYRWLLPVETRLRQMGTFGDDLAERVMEADGNTLEKTADRLLRTGGVKARKLKIRGIGLEDLTKGERYALKDALQGRVVPEKLTTRVRGLYDDIAYKSKGGVFKEIADDATKAKLKVRVLNKDGKVLETLKFKPREDFFPQFNYDVNILKKGKVREDIIENVIREGRFTSKNEAVATLNSYIQFVDGGGRKGTGEYWIKYLMKSGQAKSEDQARGMALKFLQTTGAKKFGHLEFARVLDFPFYDPDPARAIPRYIIGATARIEEAVQFGPQDEILDKVLGQLTKEVTEKRGFSQGTSLALESRMLMDKALGRINNAPWKRRASMIIKTIQTPKLAFAQMLNIGQSSNTLLATDLPSVAKGIRMAFTQEGVVNAMKSGAIMENVLREMTELVGSKSRFSNTFLKYTLFSWTERFNRIVASNAGMEYANRLTRKLANSPGNKTILAQLSELGIDGAKAVKVGLGKDDLLKAGRKVAEKTQFRARAIDLPAFATSPEGSVIFQFKNFIYNQTRFVYNQTVGELKKGHYGKGVRSLALLSMMFPVTGEVLSDVRSLATGSTRPTNYLRRYFDNIGEVGGMGMVADLFRSAEYDSLLELFSGPTASTAARTVEELTDIVKTGKITNTQKRFFLAQPGVTRPIVNYLIPSNAPNRKQIIDIFK